jgi:hypothetical protein
VVTPEAERAARQRGDVTRSRLAPAAGALLGGAVAVELGRDRIATLGGLVASLWSFRADLAPALRLTFTVVVHLVWPILVGVVVGALVIGMMQTGGWIGWPRKPLPERASPNILLAIVGWLGLVLLLGDLLRGATTLLESTGPLEVGTAAASSARWLMRAFCIASCALALADHLLRRHARGVRLVESARSARTMPLPVDEEPSVDRLLTGVERVLFAGDVAVTFARRDGAWWSFARAQGLHARALIDAARRRGLAVRTVAVSTALETLTLGAPLEDPTREALLLEEVT